MTKQGVRKIAFSGAIGALYAALTIGFAFIGYGPLQFRIAEALCILPFFFPFSVWGLFIGCIIANLMSPYPLDVVIGPVSTLLAALCTMRIGKSAGGSVPLKALACLPPVIFNAFFIGALIAYYMAGTGESGAFMAAFLLNAAQIGFSQAVVLYILGLPLMIYMPKTLVFKKLSEQYYLSR